MTDVVSLCQSLVKAQDLSILNAKLTSLGFAVEVMTFANDKGEKVDNLYAKIGQGKPHLLFAGHNDVVPTGDKSLWVQPPFDAVIDNGILYGRGISDMKGGIGCFISAVEDYLKDNILKGTISLLISGDEEEPIVDGTNEGLKVLAKRGEVFDFCLVGEPSNPNIIGEEFKIGRRGDVVFSIESIGIQGHVAYPHLADNPIHNLVELLHKMQNDVLDNGNDYFGSSTMQVTTFDVKNLVTNVIPAAAYAQVDVRFNSEHSSASIVNWLEKHISNTNGNFNFTTEVVGESFLTNKNADVELFASVVKDVCGIEPIASTTGGTSDARFVKNFCPVIEFGLTNSTIHKVNECAKVKDIELVKIVYQEYLNRYFK